MSLFESIGERRRRVFARRLLALMLAEEEDGTPRQAPEASLASI